MEPESVPEECAIQLLSISPTGNFTLHKEALDVLRGIKKKIAIVTVAGQYRTGKSFLLNRLIGKQKAFELGSTINPCTKGLWMWNKPLTITEDVQGVFLDTEGLASFSRNVHVDMKIFAMSLLMSSYFVYNSMNALDEKALESLSLVVSLSKYIHVHSHPAQVSEELDEYTQYFPFFMWVVRDFALKLMDSTQQTLSDRQYLENALRPVDISKYSDQEAATLKNEIRGKLSTFFKERDCVTLVRPVSDEKQLRMIDSLPYETLRPEFRGKIELLIKKVFCNIKPKTIDGQPLTGEMFVNLLEQYVAAFNGGVVPAISTAWEQVILLELEKVVGTSVEEYKKKAAQLSTDHFPMSVEELRKIDEEAKRAAYRVFYESGLVSVSAEKMAAARERMERAFYDIYEKLYNENYNVSYKDSEEFFNKLYGKIKEQMDQLEVLTFDVISANWQKLREFYLENAKGPAVYEVGEILTNRYLFEDVKRVCVSQREANDKKIAQLEKDIASANGIIQATKEAFEEEKSKCIKEVEDGREKAHANRLKYEATIDQLQRELAKKNPTSVPALVSKMMPAETDEHTPSYLLKLVLSEIKEKRKENENLALKVEYDQKIRAVESEYQDKLSGLKAQMKHVFNLDLQNLKLTYEHQLKQSKMAMKKKEEETELIKAELIKKESEISLLREKNKHFENERKMRLEHSEFLCRLSNSMIEMAKVIETKGPEIVKAVRHSPENDS